MASSVQAAPSVSWCDLIRAPAKHDGVIVRTTAIFLTDRENEFLYSPECQDGEGTVWVEFDPSYSSSDAAIRRQFVELIRPRRETPAGTALVTVVGRFEGSGGPYGHLDGYPFRFSIMRLERAEGNVASIDNSK